MINSKKNYPCYGAKLDTGKIAVAAAFILSSAWYIVWKDEPVLTITTKGVLLASRHRQRRHLKNVHHNGMATGQAFLSGSTPVPKDPSNSGLFITDPVA